MLVASPAMQALIARKERKRARWAARQKYGFADRHGVVQACKRVITAGLDRGDPSHFAHEGTMISVLRAVLCLRGVSWAVADTEARAVVSDALKAAGAKRPTWQQGQPEWTEGGVIRYTRTTCANCGKPLETLQKVYCSATCGDAARHRRYRADLDEIERIRRNLRRVVQNAKRTDCH